MGLDVEKARQAGYSDSEILKEIAASEGFDLEGAKKAGYSDSEILSHFETVEPVPQQDANYMDPMAPAAGAAVGRGALQSAAHAPGAVRDWWGTKSSLPEATPTVDPIVGETMPQGSGAQNWNKAMTGVSTPGSQMNKASMEANNRVASIVQPGGPLAGGEVTPSGIALGPDIRAERAAAGAKKAADIAARTPMARARAAVGKVPGKLAPLAPAARAAGTAYNTQDLLNQLNAGNTGQAALSGVGTLGSLASYLPYGPARVIGGALSVGAPIVNRVIDYYKSKEPEKKAGGGRIGALETLIERAPELKKSATEILSGLTGNAPTIMKRSGLTDLQEQLRQRNGNFGAQRVQQAADLVPNLEQQYTQNALLRAFTGNGDNAAGLMVLNPKDFEKFAAPISKNYVNSKYIDELAGIARDQGFSDVPYLMLNREESKYIPKELQDLSIAGHEGRHRTRALSDLGDQSTLIQMIPRANLREHLPRYSQQEYLDALQKDLGSFPMVRPEEAFDPVTDTIISRPRMDLPNIFKDGGPVGYGKRINNTPKERGYLGEIRMPNNRDVMTEVSVGEPGTDELFRPSIVPGIHPADLNYLRETGMPPLDLIRASMSNAKRRSAQGKSPFWNAAQDQ